jgi:diaminopimelate epimerase
MSSIPFIKMHGLGNDFVIIDGRRHPVALSDGEIRAVAARRTGIGCDQLIVIEPARDRPADAFMRIYNADGGEVGACGNATRCVASLLMAEGARDRVRLDTAAGVREAEGLDDGRIAVDMGAPGTDWRDIPLAGPADTLHLDLAAGPLSDPVAVNMGNPHAVFFVADAETVDLAALGPALEHHRMFPERANIEIAQVIDRQTIRLRVWERGAGITQACATGACAVAVAAHRRDLAGREVSLDMDGGRLAVEWRGDGHVLMTGPAAVSFNGSFEREAPS